MLIRRTLVATGFVGAMAIGTPAPSVAQGVYIGPGGVGIDTGRPAYRERYYRGIGATAGSATDRGRSGACRPFRTGGEDEARAEGDGVIDWSENLAQPRQAG